MKKGGNFSGLSRKQRRNRIIAMVVAVVLAITMVLSSIMMFFV
jgi:predicted nucleic acid-binding Zn ribbon protein